jgi:hypothetical protein
VELYDGAEDTMTDQGAESEDQPTLIVVCDMAYDMQMAYLGPLHEQDADNDWETIRAQEKFNDAAYEAWARAARRIGAEWGYEIETHPAPGDVLPEGVIPTSTPYEFGSAPYGEGRTVEGDLWQAAHDAFDVVKGQDGTWTVIEPDEKGGGSDA